MYRRGIQALCLCAARLFEVLVDAYLPLPSDSSPVSLLWCTYVRVSCSCSSVCKRRAQDSRCCCFLAAPARQGLHVLEDSKVSVLAERMSLSVTC